MIARRSRCLPVEPLSARIVRYRIARGYNINDLASAAGVYAGSIRRLESGRPVDKRIFGSLAAALGVPLCRLVCGEHSCAQRACVSGARLGDASEPPRRRWRALFARFFGILGAVTATVGLDPRSGFCYGAGHGRLLYGDAGDVCLPRGTV